MKKVAPTLLLACSVFGAACDDDKKPSADVEETRTEAKKDDVPEEEVETGGTIKIKDRSVDKDEEATLTIGPAFAYVVTEGEGDEMTYKLAEIALYNDGVEDVSCDTVIAKFDDDKMLGGSNLAVLLRGGRFREIDFEAGTPKEIGDEYKPCLWYPADFGKGPEQRSGCGYSSVDVSLEDVKLTRIGKNRIEGTIDVERSGKDEHVKGDFVAEVCPIVSLDEFLDRKGG